MRGYHVRMQRFTISLDDDLAHEFDQLIALRGYVNRSEAVRDLIREKLGTALLDSAKAQWCAATVTYVYDHLVASSLRTHLDHDNCLETVVFKGAAVAVLECASQLIALRGVRHGQVHALPLAEEGHSHRHSHAAPVAHKHLKPVN
jgi:CopG family nickel-responsive transcriptional regulator